MSNIREILRLETMKELSKRKIGYSVGCSHNTVKAVLKKANEVGLKWPLPEDLSDDKLVDSLRVLGIPYCRVEKDADLSTVLSTATSFQLVSP